MNTLKAADVIAALRRMHGKNANEWAFFDELRVGTGYTSAKDKRVGKLNSEQRLDAWAIHLWPSRGLLRRCFEVKVSRADFLVEMRQPEKRLSGLHLSNEFYFAAPAGLLKVHELPEECGLIEVTHDTATARIVKSAPHRDVEDLPMSFVASLARRAAKSERGPQLCDYANMKADGISSLI